MPVKAVEKPFVAEPAPESPAKVEAPEQQPAGLVLPKERLVFSLEGNGKAYEAQGNVIRIGRRKENQICISASEISRDHVEISVSKGLVSVLPLTETNSTRLNGRTLTGKQIIKPGDTLNLGGTDFVVVKARAL